MAVGSQWFNMQGQPVGAGTKGVVIRRDVMTDGSVRTKKVTNK